MVLLENDGLGGFDRGATVATDALGIGVAATDLNGDGVTDIVASHLQPGVGPFQPVSVGTLDAYVGGGAGSFFGPASFLVSPAISFLEAKDLNGDGLPDIVAGDLRNGGFTVTLNQSQTASARRKTLWAGGLSRILDDLAHDLLSEVESFLDWVARSDDGRDRATS